MKTKSFSYFFRFRAILLAAGLNVLAALFLLNIFSNGEHTLRQNGNWISTKNEERSYLPGFHQFISQRQALFRNRLNLGVWHGFNEVGYIHALSADELKFDASIAEDSYLWIIFVFDQDQKWGLRLSRSEKYPCTTSQILEDGSFYEKNNFTCQVAETTRIHLSIEESKISIFANEELLHQTFFAMPIKKRLRFRSSQGNVTIDNIETLIKSKVEMKEDFSPQLSLDFKLQFVIVSCLGLLLFFTVFAKLGYPYLNVSFFLVLGCAGFLTIDRFLWAPAYHYTHTIDGYLTGSNSQSGIEDLRRRFFIFLYAKLGLQKRAPSKKDVSLKIYGTGFYKLDQRDAFHKLDQDSITFLPQTKNANRVFYIGASQSWGVGAPSLEQSLISQFHRTLNSELGGAIETFALASPGKSIIYLAKYYFEIAKEWPPHFLVVHMSLREDEKPEAFENQLREIIVHAKGQKTKVFLVLEPEASALPTYRLQQTKTVLQKLSKETDAVLFDPKNFIESPAFLDSGLIWWDNSHFDTAGHQLVGRSIAQELKIKINHWRSQPSEK